MMDSLWRITSYARHGGTGESYFEEIAEWKVVKETEKQVVVRHGYAVSNIKRTVHKSDIGSINGGAFHGQFVAWAPTEGEAKAILAQMRETQLKEAKHMRENYESLVCDIEEVMKQ